MRRGQRGCGRSNGVETHLSNWPQRATDGGLRCVVDWRCGLASVGDTTSVRPAHRTGSPCRGGGSVGDAAAVRLFRRLGAQNSGFRTELCPAGRLRKTPRLFQNERGVVWTHPQTGERGKEGAGGTSPAMHGKKNGGCIDGPAFTVLPKRRAAKPSGIIIWPGSMTKASTFACRKDSNSSRWAIWHRIRTTC